MFALWFRHGNHSRNIYRIKRCIAPLCCYLFLMLLAPPLFTGCAVQQRPLDMGNDIYRILPGKYQEKALDYEARGMFREAMQSWWIVLTFHPDDVKIKERINILRKKNLSKADEHFNKGKIFYQKGQLADAHREFLLTLAYDQDHESALDYLKNRLQQPVFSTYAVQSGDTVRKVASKEYDDPNKDILIMAFNNIDSSGKLIAGNLLQIPLLGKDFLGQDEIVQVMPQNSAMPVEPRGQKNKGMTTVSAKHIPQKKTQLIDNKKSDLTRDIENYQKAREFLEQEEYQKSLKMLLSIDINFRDVRELKATTEVFLQQEADAHYRKGISYFLSEDLDKAIVEWEEVLRLSPSHLKAQKDLKNARRMKQRVEKY